jgi:hypothetical protein
LEGFQGEAQAAGGSISGSMGRRSWPLEAVFLGNGCWIRSVEDRERTRDTFTLIKSVRRQAQKRTHRGPIAA